MGQIVTAELGVGLTTTQQLGRSGLLIVLYLTQKHQHPAHPLLLTSRVLPLGKYDSLFQHPPLLAILWRSCIDLFLLLLLLHRQHLQARTVARPEEATPAAGQDTTTVHQESKHKHLKGHFDLVSHQLLLCCRINPLFDASRSPARVFGTAGIYLLCSLSSTATILRAHTTILLVKSLSCIERSGLIHTVM